MNIFIIIALILIAITSGLTLYYFYKKKSLTKKKLLAAGTALTIILSGAGLLFLRDSFRRGEHPGIGRGENGAGNGAGEKRGV